MTDNETIKALECCVKQESCGATCPYWHTTKGCEYVQVKPILDLINRQKAEIRHLQNEIDLLVLEKKSISEAWDKLRDTAMGVIKRQDAEIKKLTEQRDKAVKDFTEFAHTAFDIPFACKHCVHSVEGGRACLWKEEHEEEACLGKHFVYRGMAGAEE